MFPGVDPQKMAQVQQLTSNIRGTILVDYSTNRVDIQFETDNAEAKKALPSFMESFSQSLAQQLSSFFAIQGKIIEKNKPGG